MTLLAGKNSIPGSVHAAFKERGEAARPITTQEARGAAGRAVTAVTAAVAATAIAATATCSAAPGYLATTTKWKTMVTLRLLRCLAPPNAHTFPLSALQSCHESGLFGQHYLYCNSNNSSSAYCGCGLVMVVVVWCCMVLCPACLP